MTPTATPPAKESPPRPFRFTVQDLNTMAQSGVFKPGDRVELLEGEFVEMAPIGDDHVSANNLLLYFIQQQVGSKASCVMNSPIVLEDRTELYPDLLIQTMGRLRKGGKARPKDVLLVIEIADTSLRYDLGEKRRLYATAGIAEYWVLNVGKGELHVFTQPDPARGVYAAEQTLQKNDVVAPGAFPEARIALKEVLSFREQ